MGGRRAGPLTRHPALLPRSGRRHRHGGLLCRRTSDGHATQGLLAALHLGIQGVQVRRSVATVLPERCSFSGKPCAPGPLAESGTQAQIHPVCGGGGRDGGPSPPPPVLPCPRTGRGSPSWDGPASLPSPGLPSRGRWARRPSPFPHNKTGSVVCVGGGRVGWDHVTGEPQRVLPSDPKTRMSRSRAESSPRRLFPCCGSQNLDQLCFFP